MVLGAFIAFLEGIGLSFIYPNVETAQAQEPTNVGVPVMEAFVSTYQFFNIPFPLEYLVVGVALVMTVRYTMSFLARWLASVLGNGYEKDLRSRAFDRALDAKVAYYDEGGTDNILNAIITETGYSGRVIKQGIEILEALLLVSMYVAVML